MAITPPEAASADLLCAATKNTATSLNFGSAVRCMSQKTHAVMKYLTEIDMKPITTLADAAPLSLAWVLANVDGAKAAANYRKWHAYGDGAQSNKYDRPWTGEIAPLGTWVFDPMFGEYTVLLDMKIADMVNGEPEGGITRWPGFRQYVAWARDGSKPPPPDCVRSVNGKILCNGRRRYLAAKAAGMESMTVWFSETTITGSPRWRAEWQSETYWGRIDTMNAARDNGRLWSNNTITLDEAGNVTSSARRWQKGKIDHERRVRASRSRYQEATV